jgi:D-serine deaminase-like pyridoxal phosphate-dependent protein
MSRGIRKHKAATLAEVEMLAGCGVDDIVLGYSPVGPNIARTVAFRQRYPQVRLAVTTDHPQPLLALAEAAAAAGVSLDVLLDVNPGRDRTGVRPGPEAEILYRLIAASPALRATGLHVYDGHFQQAELTERRVAVEAAWRPVQELRDRLERQGLPVPRLLCGGTPTFPVFAGFNDPALELCPGTCVFHDQGYSDKFPDLRVFRPAALLFTRVVSRPARNRITLDLGTKSVAADPPMGQRVVFPRLPDAHQVLHNEEHLVLETERAGEFTPGDWLLAIPRHVCPCAVLYREALVIDAGALVDAWEIVARDRVLTI